LEVKNFSSNFVRSMHHYIFTSFLGCTNTTEENLAPPNMKYVNKALDNLISSPFMTCVCVMDQLRGQAARKFGRPKGSLLARLGTQVRRSLFEYTVILQPPKHAHSIAMTIHHYSTKNIPRCGTDMPATRGTEAGFSQQMA
jgi:hypothetical protein